jgi:hypothetical protein
VNRKKSPKPWCSIAAKALNNSEIKPAAEYAFREKRQSRLPFQRLKVLEHIRGNKWKAEWVDPNPGLVDYVESNQLIVSWKEHRTFLKEEDNNEALVAEIRREHHRKPGFMPGFERMVRGERLSRKPSLSRSGSRALGEPDKSVAWRRDSLYSLQAARIACT